MVILVIRKDKVCYRIASSTGSDSKLHLIIVSSIETSTDIYTRSDRGVAWG